MNKIVLGGGCFWCIEAFLQMLNGVHSVTPGYAGGTTDNPTYEDVCHGKGNHAEVVEVVYDPSILSLATLLEVFWAIHDPTTLNRQGYDVGTVYRSLIYYSNDAERPTIDRALSDAQKLWSNKIVTEIKPLDKFYEAEEYHKNFFKNNPEKAYCQVIINPKLKSIRSKFPSLMT